MADIGFGLTREDVMQLAYKIAERLENKILFVMDLQGSLGSRPFILDIQSSLSAHHNLCHTAGSSVQMKRLLVILFKAGSHLWKT